MWRPHWSSARHDRFHPGWSPSHSLTTCSRLPDPQRGHWNSLQKPMGFRKWSQWAWGFEILRTLESLVGTLGNLLRPSWDHHDQWDRMLGGIGVTDSNIQQSLGLSVTLLITPLLEPVLLCMVLCSSSSSLCIDLIPVYHCSIILRQLYFLTLVSLRYLMSQPMSVLPMSGNSFRGGRSLNKSCSCCCQIGQAGAAAQTGHFAAELQDPLPPINPWCSCSCNNTQWFQTMFLLGFLVVHNRKNLACNGDIRPNVRLSRSPREENGEINLEF